MASATALVSALMLMSGLTATEARGTGGNVAPSSTAWVAMGDSYSSGEGAPPFVAGTDVRHGDHCHRSTRAYAEDLRGMPGFPADLRFVACSGATIADFYPGKGQYGEPGQLSALTSQTKLVTLTVGGNDVKFADIAASCVVLPDCAATDDVATRALIAHTIPRLRALYQDVLLRAPRATIYVLGYPRFSSERPSLLCNGIGSLEARWISRMEDLLNAGIQRDVAQLGGSRLHYVDTSYVLEDGGLCAVKHGSIYMNGLIRRQIEYSFHPTVAGQARMAETLYTDEGGAPLPECPEISLGRRVNVGSRVLVFSFGRPRPSCRFDDTLLRDGAAQLRPQTWGKVQGWWCNYNEAEETCEHGALDVEAQNPGD